MGNGHFYICQGTDFMQKRSITRKKNNLNCVKKQPLCTDVAGEKFEFSEHLTVTWIELSLLLHVCHDLGVSA